MRELVSIGNSKSRYRLNFNPDDFDSYKKTQSPLYSFRRELKFCDDTDPVFLDSERLMDCFSALRSKDFKYYHYLLSRLVRNDEAIQVHHNEIREYFKDKSVQIVAQGIERLIIQGLIFRPHNTRGKYIINPVYAWKGNRLDYLDKNAFKD